MDGVYSTDLDRNLDLSQNELKLKKPIFSITEKESETWLVLDSLPKATSTLADLD